MFDIIIKQIRKMYNVCIFTQFLNQANKKC